MLTLTSTIEMFQALMAHIDEFIQNLFFRAEDDDPEVCKSICSLLWPNTVCQMQIHIPQTGAENC